MGAMTEHTAIAFGIIRQMAMDEGIILFYLLMTRQAYRGRNRFVTLVARGAPFFERGMQDLAEQLLGFTTVGVVAG